MKLSIIIPAYNEETRIINSLSAILEYEYLNSINYEVIIVDDGSCDATAVKAAQYKEKIKNLSILYNVSNMGKGYSIKKGMLAAKGEYCLFTDADNSTPVSELEKFWPYVNDYDILIGSRYMSGADIRVKQPFYRRVFGKIGRLVTFFIFKNIKDTQCGFKLFSFKAAKEIFVRTTIRQWGADMEILFIAQKLRYKIKEIPITWINSSESKVKILAAAFNVLFSILKIKKNHILGKYNLK
jgi:dolichyl-phosphate beta-glucosyltransferase